MQDELPAVNDPELECTKNCQDPFSGQDPDDGAIKLLAAVCDGELDYEYRVSETLGRRAAVLVG